MSEIEEKLRKAGFVLPAAFKRSSGVAIPFAWARARGNRVYVSGHAPLKTDGSLAGPFGPVPSQVSLEAAQQGARATALAILASLKQQLGDLDRICAWLTVAGMVNADPGFAQTTLVMNPFSTLITDLFGDDVGSHARTAIGVSALPLNNTVLVSAEIEFV